MGLVRQVFEAGVTPRCDLSPKCETYCEVRTRYDQGPLGGLRGPFDNPLRRLMSRCSPNVKFWDMSHIVPPRSEHDDPLSRMKAYTLARELLKDCWPDAEQTKH